MDGSFLGILATFISLPKAQTFVGRCTFCLGFEWVRSLHGVWVRWLIVPVGQSGSRVAQLPWVTGKLAQVLGAVHRGSQAALTVNFRLLPCASLTN